MSVMGILRQLSDSGAPLIIVGKREIAVRAGSDLANRAKSLIFRDRPVLYWAEPLVSWPKLLFWLPWVLSLRYTVLFWEETN
jgi:hypothetical protein